MGRISFREFNVDSRVVDSELIQRKWFKQGRAVLGYKAPRSVIINGTVYKNTIGVSIDMDKHVLSVALKTGQETAIKFDSGAKECDIDMEGRDLNVSFK